MGIEMSVVNQAAVAATTHGQGSQNSLIVPAGMSLKIETSPAGQNIFNEVTPVGKVRSYSITVSYAEIDA